MAFRNPSYLFIFFILFFCKINFLEAQSPSTIDFGQNRVQYKDFKWQFYETENFRIYFYKGGQDLGKYAILNAENILEDLTKSLDFRLKKKLDLIIYNDISDLRQSNIGLYSGVQFDNGEVKLLDNKLFVYFNGKHKFIDDQIREGITKIFIKKFVTGSGLKETITNSVLPNFPEWYINGLQSYLSQNWNTELENKLKDGILSGKLKNLLKLNTEEMSFVAHSTLHYTEEKLGKDAVLNLIYLINTSESLDRGFSYVTDKRLSQFFEEWYYFYLKRFKKEKNKFSAIEIENFVPIKIKKNRKVYEAKLNPNGKSIGYITNEDGKWKVHIYDLETKEDVVVMKGGFRTNTVKTDLMNPMISWDKRGEKLTMIYELRDKFFLRNYVMEEEKLDEEAPIRKFQKIFSFSYAEDSRNLLFSAMRKGQIDIYKYYIPSTKVSQITNDFYDDLQPSYVELENKKGYIFVSNRKSDMLQKARLNNILPNGSFDVFFYELEENTQSLIRITNTPLINESRPSAYNKKYYSFLSDENGINNQYLGNFIQQKADDNIRYVYSTNEFPDVMDTIVLEPNVLLENTLEEGESLKEILFKKNIPVIKTVGDYFLATNYNNGIGEISNSDRANKKLELIDFKQKKRFVLSNYKDEFAQGASGKTDYIKHIENLSNPAKEVVADTLELDSVPIEVIEKNIVFQSKFDDWQNDTVNGYVDMLDSSEEKEIEETSDKYKFKRTRQYFIKLMADRVNLSIDNKLIINPYQKFNPNSPVFNNTSIAGFVKFGVKDLFENHRIHGGFRISDRNIIPQEFYMTYENLTKRLDKEITFYRNTISNDITSYDGQNLNFQGTESFHTNYLHLKLKYSIDILNSFRIKIAGRNELTTYKSTENITLEAENHVTNWLELKAEYVHDHTIKIAPRVLNGFRANAYVEFQKEIPTQDVLVFNQNLKLPDWNDGYLTVIGGDARHYLKVYKTITWANRVALGTSFGTRKLLYYLGGSDGQLLPGYNEDNEVSKSENYAFQTLAQNLRGMPQNTRNGNSYLVINSEFRMPLFSAFSKTTMKSKFLQSFQLIGFFDVGTAWEGFSPWNGSNIHIVERPNNTDLPESATAIVRLNIYKDPIVFSFGPGVRFDLFGYFFKFDLGWGFDTGELLAPKMHVSMTYDF